MTGATERRRLILRFASGAIGIPVLAAAIWAGGVWLSILVGAVAALGALELCGMARRAGMRPAPLVAVVWSLSPVAAAHIVSADLSTEFTFRALVGIAAFAYLVWQVHHARERLGWRSWAITAGVAMYTGGLLAFAPLLRGLDQGMEWVLLVILVTFANDTSAFFIGRRFGRRPLAPRISPGKTWEGSAGGMTGAIGACVALSAIMGLALPTAQAVILGTLLAIVGQLGDLLESRLKRQTGVKDSGWAVPGHGGLMDRMDSIVFNLAVMYYFLIWVVQ